LHESSKLQEKTDVNQDCKYLRIRFTPESLVMLDVWFTAREHRTLRIISHRAIREFTANHKAATQPLDDWYRVAKRAVWNSLADVRMTYPHADLVGSCVVFNIGGNKYRLISRIAFKRQVLYIRFIVTHKDYDEGGWKHDCGA
jgi:mRNA interferase HigB